MTYNVYQHWDPLKVCVVGRSYPPEFYSWIKIPHVRELFERIAIETEEDFQCIIKKLAEFGVKILRPTLPVEYQPNQDGRYDMPPMTPRDYTAMIGNTFYYNYGWGESCFETFYNNVKDPAWPECKTLLEFEDLPQEIKNECKETFHMDQWVGWKKIKNYTLYDHILDHISQQGNPIKHGVDPNINGAMVSRIGQDLYFGTSSYTQGQDNFRQLIETEFPNNRTHIVNTGGHGDSTYCPVTPGLIISLLDVPTYQSTFPDWEVIYLPNQSWEMIKDFMVLKKKNKGRWWIPGFEHDIDVVDTVEKWLSHWTGYVEETVFDINMLIINPKNVMVFNYNKQVFDALDRYGITAHVVPFRHRYFWDGGIHCVTSDLHREGTKQDFFPNRLKL